MTNQIERRNFLKTGLIGAGVTMASGSVLGANDRVRVGVIGCGRQGRSDTGSFMSLPEVEIVAVCDVYEPQIAEVKKRAKDAEVFKDYRKLLDRKDIDAVIIGSHDHWHALHSTSTALLGNVALRSGRRIVWNRQLEKVENDVAANKFLSREYRKPYKLSV